MANEPATTLGALLGGARGIKGLSVRKTAELSEITPTYLQKLESGDVRAPSPHILNRLAKVLGVVYADLMRAAGYVVPRSGEQKLNVLAGALKSASLSEKETEQMLEYLAFLRTRKKGK